MVVNAKRLLKGIQYVLKRIHLSLLVEDRIFLGEIKFIDLGKNIKYVSNLLVVN